MTRLRIRTPSRLHFGLLGWGPSALRQFGGVGLMIEQPGFLLTAARSDGWEATGPFGPRVLETAEAVVAEIGRRGHSALAPVRFEVSQFTRPHVGLGSGTQLGLAVARAIAVLNRLPDPGPIEAARWTGRGRRSGVGIYGHALGGLIVDGGHRETNEASVPPLLSHMPFPDDWHVLLVQPGGAPGLAGSEERAAFGRLASVPDRVTERLCHLVLLGLLPAVREHDLLAFGAALEAIQAEVGRVFAPAQGGSPYASPAAAPIVDWLRDRGLVGVGQSSWGPILYAFTDRGPADREALETDLRTTFQLPLPGTSWTGASASGARFECED